jgi:hypothetical protein
LSATCHTYDTACRIGARTVVLDDVPRVVRVGALEMRRPDQRALEAASVGDKLEHERTMLGRALAELAHGDLQ